MSDTKNTGGPAFPTPNLDWDVYGMTLRDYFAAKAMQGMVASGAPDPAMYEHVARKCYMMADALLKAREQ